jgi:hypothetical protein
MHGTPKMPTPAKGTIYDLFRNTYPDYTGELKHFQYV